VAAVERVCDVPTPFPAPVRDPAVRGVMSVADRLIPVVNLAAVVRGGAAPAERGEIGVVVRYGTRLLVIEVDDAPGLEHGAIEPLPIGWRGGWAAAAVQVPEGLVPLLDVGNLFERLTAATESR
jgi:chemotaxis signal transduction protein